MNQKRQAKVAVVIGAVILLTVTPAASSVTEFGTNSNQAATDNLPDPPSFGNKTYRLFANNDRDNPGGLQERYNPTLEYRTLTNDSLATVVRLDNAGIPPGAPQTAAAVDTYRLNLSAPVEVPTAYRKKSIVNMDRQDTVISGQIPTGVRVDMDSRNATLWVSPRKYTGYYPVVNATVVKVGTNIIIVNQLGAKAILPKETKPFEQLAQVNTTRQYGTSPNVSTVPQANSKPVWKLSKSSSLQYNETDKSFRPVTKHWVGVPRTDPGAYYNNTYIVHPDRFEATVISDYLITRPDTYHEDGSCTFTRDNSTIIRDEDIYEYWNVTGILTSQRTRLSGVPGSEQETKHGHVYAWNNPSDGELTVISRVTVVYKHKVERRSRCPNRNKTSTETVSITHETTTTVDIATADIPRGKNQIFVVTRNNRTFVYLQQRGQMTPIANPLSRVTITLPTGQQHTILTQWVAVPQTITGSIRYISNNFNNTQSITGSPSGSTPPLFRTYVVGAPIRDTTPPEASEASPIPGIDFSGSNPTVLRGIPRFNGTTIGTGSLVIPRKYGGEIETVPPSALANATYRAFTFAGNSREIENIERIRYRESLLTVSLNRSANPITATITLNSTTGVPIKNRKLILSGAKKDSVKTDALGQATVTVTGTVLQVKFPGDPVTADVARHYERTRTSKATIIASILTVTETLQFVTAAIDETVLIIEWVGLGLFIIWWRRYSPD